MATQFKSFTGSTDQEFAAWLKVVVYGRLWDLLHADGNRNGSGPRVVSLDSLASDPVAPNIPAETVVEVQEFHEQLEAALKELPANQEKVLRLFLDGGTPQEISSTTKQSRSNVYKLISRSLIRLRFRLRRLYANFDFIF